MNDNGIIEIVPISVSQALQIAGRAGRYGSRYEKVKWTKFFFVFLYVNVTK